MASDLNSVILVGRLTRESEIRYSQNGGAVVRFSIAINRRKRTGENKWEDEANFFDCVYFGKAAESINQYLEKGRQVAIQGELRQNRWEQDGQARSKVEVMVNNLQLLSSGNGGSGSNGENQNPYRATSSQNNTRSQQSSYTRAGQNNQRVPSAPQDDFTLGPEVYADDDVPF